VNILFLVAHPIENASSRYCVYQFVPYFEAAGHKCTVRPFSTQRLYRVLHKPGLILTKSAHMLWCTFRRFADVFQANKYDLVIIHREAFPFLTPVMENFVFSRNPRVVYAFDDAIYVGHGDHSSENHSRRSPLYRLKYGSGVNKIITRSIHVMAGNEVLALHSRQFNNSVSIFPTVIDLEQYTLSPRGRSAEGPVTIGWCGSHSTAPYLASIVNPLRSLAKDFPGKVRFRFFGAPELALNLPDFEARPFCLSSEISDLRQIDIGLMPMPDTEWTRGKCAFKAVQYMALGAAAVVSPVGASAKLVENGVNGFLATTEEEWYSILRRLILDADLRHRIGQNARETIERRYSVQVWAPQFLNMLEEIGSTGCAFPIGKRPSRCE
jgi:glycosyltransferase involved in cell wall biosynthesis